ncbi:dTDP-4-dehydrorhamnose reductase [Marinobacter nauticus]|uniref:dTDP-4-dehydrorhamnose reductase n=1 Tax=Marinobacter nauticus TaxID=2743 RepID=UPI003517325B
MRILLFGGEGQVGWELGRALSVLGQLVVPARKPGAGGDLSDLEGLRQIIRRHCPDVVVNAAAYTDVAAAEHERESAFAINALAPEVMAQEAARCGALMVHYSTDYVYDGQSDDAYSETDVAQPLNVYGESKFDGDRRVMASGCDYLVFRTSWVYSVRGKNFLTTMLKLLRERNRLKVVHDQRGAPTSAELLADVTAHAVARTYPDRALGGLYHLTASGATSWYGYSCLIADRLRERSAEQIIDDAAIVPVTAAVYGSEVLRPKNSCLNTSRLEKAFDLVLPDWTTGVIRVVDEWLYFEKRRQL